MPHIHEQIDFTVSAYIVHEEKVLLIHHKQLNKWLPIGGHIELDEDPNQALFREIAEESGLQQDELIIASEKPSVESPGTKILYPPSFLDIHEISGTHRHVGMVYFLKSSTDRLQLAQEEHNHIRWFLEEELDNTELDLNPGVRFYALHALRLFR